MKITFSIFFFSLCEQITVKYAVDTTSSDKKAFAIKIIDRKMIHKENMESQLKREIAIMKILKHPHIIQLKEVLQSAKHIYIVLELITGGELFDRIVQAKRFPEHTARRYFQSLMSAVEYTHSQGIAHRDLKPENLLLDENDTLKITDFGLSALSSSSDGRQKVLSTVCGTPNYVAPEVIKDRGYSGFQADVWSCGVILYVMIAGYLPFEDDTMQGLFQKIEGGQFSFPKHFSPEVRKLISKMLVVNPKKRISVQQIMQDPWFKVGFKRQDTKKIVISDTQVQNSIQEAKVSDETVTPNSGGSDTESTPRTLNAFDLFGSMMQGVVSPLMSGTVKIRRETRFAAEGSADLVTTKIMDTLRKMRANPQQKKDEPIKCVLHQNATLLTFSVEIVGTSGGFSMVEVQRRKGDILHFNSFYRSLIEALGDLVVSKDTNGSAKTE
uniref:non-specific serine/threonine protein kinase n=1 Tax=Percolomonas cosmopolitus TaxID=63605 RepID=A0A7S1KQL4_9EUKA|mmetsp:Transcript_4302/g.16223  ORF Transcript_4302/g.16223 Transcript_4302/m.16223 type:complete len:440 (+) Transcript_4302:466-1785(+)